MKVNITNNLWLETDIPMLSIEQIKIKWKPGAHASLKLEGFIQPDAVWNQISIYGSGIKVWIEETDRTQVLFHGLLKYGVEKNSAQMRQVYIEGISASVIHDRKKESRSFQDIGCSYYEMIKHNIEPAGGQVICTADKEKGSDKPMIQYKETNWEFAQRLASHLGTFLVPDIETGNANFWIGMKKGQVIPEFSESSYSVELDSQGICCWIKSYENYQLGDQTSFLGEDFTIYEKYIHYINGELHYFYVLRNKDINTEIKYQEHFSGLTLNGIVRDVKEETVSIALEIDGGANTGEYYYEWLSITGNILYAMPEPGASVSLHFINMDEGSGIAVHCSHSMDTKGYSGSNYRVRKFNVLESGSIQLSRGSIDLSKQSENINMSEEEISSETSSQMNITAKENIIFKADTIILKTPDKIKIYQG